MAQIYFYDRSTSKVLNFTHAPFLMKTENLAPHLRKYIARPNRMTAAAGGKKTGDSRWGNWLGEEKEVWEKKETAMDPLGWAGRQP